MNDINQGSLNSDSRDNVYGAVVVAVNCHCESSVVRLVTIDIKSAK